MKTTVHHTSRRAWGYETLLTVVDDDGGVWGECIVTPEYPKEYDAVIAEAETNVTNRLARLAAKAEPETQYTESEVEKILIEKGYLTEEETLDDLKSKEDLLADQKVVGS